MENKDLELEVLPRITALEKDVEYLKGSTIEIKAEQKETNRNVNEMSISVKEMTMSIVNLTKDLKEYMNQQKEEKDKQDNTINRIEKEIEKVKNSSIIEDSNFLRKIKDFLFDKGLGIIIILVGLGVVYYLSQLIEKLNNK